MKRYIYALLVAIIFTTSCSDKIDESQEAGETPFVEVLDDGSLRVCFKLSMQSSSSITVDTRAANSDETYVESGWAVVFAEDESAEDGYSDTSKLLQKTSFKVDGFGNAFVVFSEQTSGCFVRLIANLTDNTQNEVYAMVSQKDVTDGVTDSGGNKYTEDQIATFDDYKHLDVGLLGYYNLTESNPNPDPTNLRSGEGFPCASPGFAMPDGLNETTIKALGENVEIQMVQVGSKLDAESSCGFKITGLRLYNGAKRAMMRSTVLQNDGLNSITDLPLPTNLGGVCYDFAWVAANSDGESTSDTPIYFYPNEGDAPWTGTGDPEYDDEVAATTTPNPTYVLISGVAEGYEAEGYYKVAIKYDGSEVSDDYTDGTITYDILRNGHYTINLKEVGNPGYATEAEAIAGPESDVSYSITVSTNDDARNETIISGSGLYSMELDASSVYVQGWSDDGIELDMSVWFGQNSDVTGFDYDTQKGYILGSENVEILTIDDTAYTDGVVSSVNPDAAYKITFNVTGDGTITVRYGDIAKEIPVYHENTNLSMLVATDTNSIFNQPISEFSGTIYEYDGTTRAESSSGTVFFNTENSSITQYLTTGVEVTAENFYGREFDGYVYPTDMSGGVIRLFCHQGSMPFHGAYVLNTEPITDDTAEPYYMMSYKDFDHLATAVNGSDGTNIYTAQTFSGSNFKMLQDVDMQEDVASGKSRECPTIGVNCVYYTYGMATSYDNYFSGNFNGVNYSVNNLVISETPTEWNTGYEIQVTYKGQGLFSYINYATIENLTVSGSVKGSTIQHCGGIVGCAMNSTITNCTNKATVDNTTLEDSNNIRAGGIAGYSENSVFSYCYNKNTVTGTESIGGISGLDESSSFRNCDNESTITGENYVGGITGYTWASDKTDATKFVDCSNSGSVSGSQYVGGVSGRAAYSDFSECTNTGSVSSTSSTTSTNANTGGIAGSATYATIENCTNGSSTDNTKGAVTGNAYRIGGIVGYISTYDNTISGCYNYATVEGAQSVGGVAGYAETSSSYTHMITECYNHGSVKASDSDSYAGGVVGYTSYVTIDDCHNEGSVDGAYTEDTDGTRTYSTSYIGGILGYAYYTTTVNECTNSGSVGGYQYVGGMVGGRLGNSGYHLSVSGCTNEGAITGSDWYVGGMVGYAYCYTTINNSCKNTGAITGLQRVGGIAGITYGTSAAPTTVSSCTNEGVITSTAVYGDTGDNSHAGGIVGYGSGYTTIEDCKNTSTGTVTGKAHNVSGILGVSFSYTLTVKNCYNAAAISGYQYIGGIVSYLLSSISGCTNSGSVEATITNTYPSYVGGITGWVNKDTATIDDCHNLDGGDITGYRHYVGGIAGNFGGTLVSNCTNSASVKSDMTSGESSVAGIVGYVSYASATIEKCHNDTNGNITGSQYVGGIVGYHTGSLISDCTNSASVKATNTSGSSYVAGIVGYVSSTSATIESCHNNTDGDITGIQYVGGITGRLYGTQISDCTNSASVKATNTSGYSFVGGIAGHVSSTSATIENCDNYTGGIIEGYQGVGGIVGYIYNSSNTSPVITISQCTNNGPITSTSKYVSEEEINQSFAGGIAGWVFNTIIAECQNKGTVTGGSQNVGGVLGLASYSSSSRTTLYKCYNSADVSGYQYVGGVTTYLQYCTVNSCGNTGAVTGTVSNIGGVASNILSGGGYLFNSYNTGVVTGEYYVGGVVGEQRYGIYNCYNAGIVSSTGTSSNYGPVMGGSGSDSGNSLDSDTLKTYNTYSYYLSSITGGNSYGQPTVATTMQSATFQGTLNTNVNASSPSYVEGTSTYPMSDWSYDAEKNSGYPYLSWEDTITTTE